MKKTLKKITHYFKTDTELFLEKLNDNRKMLDHSIKEFEQNIQNLESALANQIALGHYFSEKKTYYLMRIESLDKLIIQYVKMHKDTAAKEMIREKLKEEQKLKGLHETIEIHNQRIKDYQHRLKIAIHLLDQQIINREAFIIKQHIAIQELKILEQMNKGKTKENIQWIQKEILGKETYKLLVSSEEVTSDVYLDNEIERELDSLKRHYL